MRALLVYYMVKQLLMGQAQASLIYGLYTAFVHLTPIAGGVILSAGLFGTLWSKLSAATFFILCTVIAGVSAGLLLLLNRAVRDAEAATTQ